LAHRALLGFDTFNLIQDTLSEPHETIPGWSPPPSHPGYFSWGLGSAQGANGSSGTAFTAGIDGAIAGGTAQAYFRKSFKPSGRFSCPNMYGRLRKTNDTLDQMVDSLMILPAVVKTVYFTELFYKKMGLAIFVNSEDGSLWCSLVHPPVTVPDKFYHSSWVSVQGLVTASPQWGWYLDNDEKMSDYESDTTDSEDIDPDGGGEDMYS
jgi:hypothetical protein